jgi:thymidylate kinase
VREGFLTIARAAPERCVVIDATQPEAAVASRVRAAVHARLGLDLSGAG